jgi:hypothetical protein
MYRHFYEKVSAFAAIPYLFSSVAQYKFAVPIRLSDEVLVPGNISKD